MESLPSLNQGNVSIPNHERLLRELRGLERRVHRSGKDSVDHGAHGSDDCANALAGCLYVALLETRRLKTRVGAAAIGPGLSGKVSWRHGKEREPLRIRTIYVSEREALEQGLRTAAPSETFFRQPRRN